MTERGEFTPPADFYSPQRRTALVLSGIGADGAYHAGVLRALHEAGVKLDVVAGRGIGVVGALFAAIDGAQQLWTDKGFWRAPAVQSFYQWRPLLRLIVVALAASFAIVALPLAVMALGLAVFPIDFTLKMIGAGSGNLVPAYLRMAQSAFEPGALPTWLPRLVLLVLALTAVIAAIGGWRPGGRQARHLRQGSRWWRFVHAPLSTGRVAEHCWRVMWDLLRGAAQVNQPAAGELARRYTELLAENIGQPGFRELLIVVHDIDARRDLVFTLLAEPRRRELGRRAMMATDQRREAETFDVSGVAREYLTDAVAAALTIPVATELRPLRFAPGGYWRGETHRLCDRPASLARLVEELRDIDVEQIILVSAAAGIPGPHALFAPRIDGRGRLGEYLQASEVAAVGDLTRVVAGKGPSLFTIRPSHNPIGPFDFAGAYDDRSDRRQPLAEALSRGYEDAYRQFIEPVLGASGERVGQGAS